jgi:glycosyltransferase involved in cell wall biosynthesis
MQSATVCNIQSSSLDACQPGTTLRRISAKVMRGASSNCPFLGLGTGSHRDRGYGLLTMRGGPETSLTAPTTGDDRRPLNEGRQRPDPLAGHGIAVLNEWIERIGGAERVLTAACEALPGADVYALWDDRTDPDQPVHESWLARTPLRGRKALALPLMPMVWRTQTRQRYDIVLSFSHSLNHTAKLPVTAGGVHLSYIHTPARYLWLTDVDSRRRQHLGQRLAVAATKHLEQHTSRHVTAYAANSHEVRRRIEEFWHRDATVIYPPARTTYFTDPPASDRSQARDYILGLGRWVEYKRFDFMIEVAERAGLPLVIAGAGPMEEQLRRQAASASVDVTFHVRPSDDTMRSLLWGARCLLFPGHEDFGIVPVEAQACGTPVIGLARGGLLETVVDGATGQLIDSLDPVAFARAIQRASGWSPEACQANAAHFSEDAFHTALRSWIIGEASCGEIRLPDLPTHHGPADVEEAPQIPAQRALR